MYPFVDLDYSSTRTTAAVKTWPTKNHTRYELTGESRARGRDNNMIVIGDQSDECSSVVAEIEPLSEQIQPERHTAIATCSKYVLPPAALVYPQPYSDCPW